MKTYIKDLPDSDFWKSKTILVTGGMGFIGSNLIKKLNELGCSNILIYDKPTPENLKNIVGLNYKEVVFEGIEKYEFDLCFHLAANSSTLNKDFSNTKENNIDFSKLIINYCRSVDVPIFYASSAATYGNVDVETMSDDVDGLHVNSAPENLYAFSKHSVDLWAKNSQGKFHPSCVALKYFNVWGPRDLHKGDMRSYFTKIYLSKLKKEAVSSPFTHFDSKRILRDFIYVDDAVAITLLIAEETTNEQSEGFNVFNIGTGKPNGFLMFYEAAFSFSRSSESCLPTKMKNGYQIQTKADIKKIASLIKEASFSDFDCGIKECMSWIDKECNVKGVRNI